MDFKDIVGQEQVIYYLRQMIINKKIAHAYIFEGPPEVGKIMAAKAFAKGIQCKNYGQEVCNICAACVKANRNNHPDIKIIEPEGKSIKNRQIEEFQQDLLRKPYESHKKVYIIKNANDMTISAQNRLLKTLEEPPSYAVIILISTNVNSFLPTIKSRCQILKFHRVGEKHIQRFMINKYGICEEQARVFAAFSDGIPGRAIKLKESEEFKTKREKIIEMIEELLQNNPLKAFELVDFFQQNKDNIDEILDFMLFWFRDILILMETGSEKFLINLDKKSTLQKHLHRIGYEKITHIIEEIEKTKNDIKANVNFQLAVEMMLLNIQEV